MNNVHAVNVGGMIFPWNDSCKKIEQIKHLKGGVGLISKDCCILLVGVYIFFFFWKVIRFCLIKVEFLCLLTQPFHSEKSIDYNDKLCNTF